MELEGGEAASNAAAQVGLFSPSQRARVPACTALRHAGEPWGWLSSRTAHTPQCKQLAGTLASCTKLAVSCSIRSLVTTEECWWKRIFIPRDQWVKADYLCLYYMYLYRCGSPCAAAQALGELLGSGFAGPSVGAMSPSVCGACHGKKTAHVCERR